MSLTDVISAAGGVVWRRGPDPEPLVALVHRSRHDDWSLPKGKLRRGEHPLAAAVREVAEETAVRAIPRQVLPAIRYRVDGVPKVVEYWSMAAAEVAAFTPNSEVDGIAWLPAGQAVRQVSYGHDADLLRGWASLPPVSAVVLVVRHADAGDRYGSPAADQERPLSRQGIADAEAMCRLLGLFAPDRLVSASPRRCRQSLEPLAAASDLRVQVDPVFDEAADDPDLAARRLGNLAETGATTVVCSQGAVIPAMLARIAGGGERIAAGAHVDESDLATPKGDGWLLPFSGPRPLVPTPLDTRRVRQ